MKITIACVGKLKEKYLTAALDEYVKRLQPFCKLEILSINEEKMPQEPSEAERNQVLEKESQRLLEIIPEHSYVVLLDLQESRSPVRNWRKRWTGWPYRA